MRYGFLRSILCAVVLFWSGALRVRAESPRSVVGIILPLAGPNQAFGEGLRNGCLLAYEKLPAAQRALLRLRFEDDSYTASKALTAAQALFQSEKNLIGLVTVSSGPSGVVAPLAERKRTPLIAIATNDGFVRGREFVRSLWTDPALEAQVIVEEMRRRGYKRIARITAESPVLVEIIKHMDRQLKGAVHMALDERVGPAHTDFHPLLLRIKQQGPIDGLMLNLLPGSLAPAAKQARELGLRAQIFNIEVACGDPHSVAEAQGALLGSWCGTSARPSEAFLSEFRARFPGSLEIGAANCFDAVTLFAQALAAGARTPAEAAQHIFNRENFHGACGVLSVKGAETFGVGAAVEEVTLSGVRVLRGR